MQLILLLGRIFFTFIFILSGYYHFTPAVIQYAAEDGLQYANFLVPLSGVIAALGGLSILLGYKARWGAWLIVLFLIPVTYHMHDFWTFSDPIEYATQQAMFYKNLSILGGALFIAYFGSGPLSIKE